MATSTNDLALPFPSPEPTVPLEMGDHLTREEFERRYHATPGVKKAELIDGVVYMPSPVGRRHGRPHVILSTWLGNYFLQTPGLDTAGNATVRFDDLSEPQPDLLLALEPAAGGRCHVDDDDYFSGPPEFIAEVASSSVSYDLHAKLHVYRRHGVREYLVWRVRDNEVDWFRLQEETYLLIAADESGLLKSTVFPGLWLDADALVRGDLTRVFNVLQQGIESPEHVGFVDSLKDQRQTP